MMHIVDEDMSRRRLLRSGVLAGYGFWAQQGGLLSAQAPAGVAGIIPASSEVCFSARFTNQAALPIARQLGATRLDWTYSLDREFLMSARAFGAKVIGGTINACMPDQVGGRTYLEGRALDRHGARVSAPWMKGEQITRYWGCPNNPAYEEIMLEGALAALKAGADYLQFDDAALTAPSVQWGACWCKYCRETAVQDGYALPGHMLQFQQVSTERFITRLRSRLNKRAGRFIIMSSNNYGGSRGTPYNIFDFGMCELPEEKLSASYVTDLFRSFEPSGWRQVVTLQTDSSHLNRAAIATVHACGGNCIVPWDVFLATNRRYFGKVTDYDRTYRMIREGGKVLDGKRFASLELGELLTADVLDELARAGMHVILREDAKSFVIHFIPWNEGTGFISGALLPIWKRNPFILVGATPGEAATDPLRFTISRQHWSIFILTKAS